MINHQLIIMDNLIQSFSLLPILLALIIYTFYKYLTKNHGYWISRGIPEAKGAIIGIGHMKNVVLRKKNLATCVEDIVKEHKTGSMFGIYEFRQPILIVRDPNLIKFVLQTGFNSFSEHPTFDEDLDPLFSREPLLQNNQEWRESRGFVLNAFSIKKIKEMIPLVHDVSNKFLNYIDTKVPSSSSSESESVEMKNIYSKFTASITASIILGIDAETFVDNEPPFSLLSMIEAIFHPKKLSLRQTLVFFYPSVSKLIGTGFVPVWINEGFQKIVDHVVSVREAEKTPRNDTLQLIIERVKNEKRADKAAAAYAFGFFMEIYETTSIALGAMTYYLAKHSDIQDKARREINKSLMNHGDELTYEALNEMEYMDQIIRETLRLIPPGGRLIKNCTEPVTLEGSDGLRCKLDKGDRVVIPVFSIHKSPEHWDDPEEFRPERFDKSFEAERNNYTFLSFGEGQRKCPGIKFTFLQIKLVMALILTKYALIPSDKMQEPIEIDPRPFFTTVQGGYWIKIRRLTK